MKTCLSDKKKKQHEKMTACNKDAGDKKGAERKSFMKECPDCLATRDRAMKSLIPALAATLAVTFALVQRFGRG